jgi:hypothetical protein
MQMGALDQQENASQDGNAGVDEDRDGNEDLPRT